MARPQMKYNPAFLTDQQIIEGFVVRHAEFESILETLRENTTQSNQHLLVIGPAIRFTAPASFGLKLCCIWQISRETKDSSGSIANFMTNKMRAVYMSAVWARY